MGLGLVRDRGRSRAMGVQGCEAVELCHGKGNVFGALGP